MKKIVQYVLVLCLAAVFAALAVACGTQETPGDGGGTLPPGQEQEQEKPEEDPPTAYEKLNQDEKALFDAFKPIIDNFKDPSSVRIIKVNQSYYDGAVIDFQVSAANSYGAAVTEGYLLFAKYWLAPGYTEMTNGSYWHGAFAGTMLTYDDARDRFTAGALLALFSPEEEDVDNKSYSVANLNAAIQEYKQEQGWIA